MEYKVNKIDERQKEAIEERLLKSTTNDSSSAVSEERIKNVEFLVNYCKNEVEL